METDVSIMTRVLAHLQESRRGRNTSAKCLRRGTVPLCHQWLGSLSLRTCAHTIVDGVSIARRYNEAWCSFWQIPELAKLLTWTSDFAGAPLTLEKYFMDGDVRHNVVQGPAGVSRCTQSSRLLSWAIFVRGVVAEGFPCRPASLRGSAHRPHPRTLERLITFNKNVSTRSRAVAE